MRCTLKEYATIRVKRISSVPRGGTSSRYLIFQLRLSRYKYSANNSVRPGSLRYGVQSIKLKSWWNIIGGCRYRCMYLSRAPTPPERRFREAIQRNDYYGRKRRGPEERKLASPWTRITNASSIRPRTTCNCGPSPLCGRATDPNGDDVCRGKWE